MSVLRAIAGIIVGYAIFATGFGAEPVWYKVGTLLLTAPAILLIALRRRGAM